MKKLLIIDGSSLLFQSFYGMPRKIQNQRGQYVEAVICFVGILFKTINIFKPTEVFVVFDGENELSRKEIDNEYKANRTDFNNVSDEDNPFLQLEIIQQVLTSLNLQWFETKNCEADDLIASIVNDYKTQYEIIISSQDKDFFQLIDENISVFTYRGKVSKMWTNEEIKTKFGFEAKHFSTFKSLVGDNSDNIKGIKGIGTVTATKLIQDFQNLSNIFLHLEQLTSKIKQLLIENKTKVFNNFQIIELHSKHNLFSLPNCEFSLPNASSTSVLKQLNILQ